MSDQLRIGSAIAGFFRGGGGPSHSAIGSAFMAAGYAEPFVDKDQNKQERVNRAFRRTLNTDLQNNLVGEFFLILYGEGYLDNHTTPAYKRLVGALEESGRTLDETGFLVDKDEAVTESDHDYESIAGTQASDTESPKKRGTRRVLISHAEADAKAAGEIARFIELVCRLDKRQILCTSVDGYGLDPGEEWIYALRQSVRDGDLIIFLISEAFLSSDFCGFELGAAWMAEDQLQRFPMRSPDVAAEDLTALPGSWHCPTVSKTVLSALVDRIVERCGVRQPPAAHLTSDLTSTMAALNTIW